MAHNDWVDWWLQTNFGRKSKINWDSTRHAEIWDYYHQVAHSVDGALKVMCQRCGAILEHPYTVNSKTKGKIQYHGTSTMQKHLKTAGRLKSERGKRAEITEFLKNSAFIAITGYFIDADWVYREVLLGFKPLYGPHTSVNLSSVVLQTLMEHNLESRVFGLTTDNASNNKTLIPCLAHVIQLNFNQLLDRIKSRLAQANAQHQGREISYTLNKVRYLVIYVNASPQRRETFYNLQTSSVKLVPIQDVRTRWNSTFLMLRQAKRLRSIFTPFCAEYDCEEMLLQDEEWRQVDYLLSHYVFKIYNKLFEHLKQLMKQLRRKRAPWKQQMLHALEAGQTKLDEYYSQTDYIPGHIYAVSTMLAPVNKFKFFLTKDWDQKWRDIYRKSFQ
ncbi:hypothetical protein TSTA_035710 [Talaromyces stipitatus ATCC 10500]|uniref:BED-type domain-containing protein n=1 Tax=Talaromyces stipitatus (strain ATCC 10500 / CBS 375.48 / QM 6759 / NRRL 1006) TaxID=441959 RepID=B8M7C5_TALSN|nr:uncharacterized protein TSTA_035710 [Talaromyces stipitatus ATCC 10500]EED20345.1 hypothetical protein TSTA_035710 [Talaromyces stipitatus ATCC 10500]